MGDSSTKKIEEWNNDWKCQIQSKHEKALIIDQLLETYADFRKSNVGFGGNTLQIKFKFKVDFHRFTTENVDFMHADELDLKISHINPALGEMQIKDHLSQKWMIQTVRKLRNSTTAYVTFESAFDLVEANNFFNLNYVFFFGKYILPTRSEIVKEEAVSNNSIDCKIIVLGDEEEDYKMEIEVLLNLHKEKELRKRKMLESIEQEYDAKLKELNERSEKRKKTGDLMSKIDNKLEKMIKDAEDGKLQTMRKDSEEVKKFTKDIIAILKV